MSGDQHADQTVDVALRQARQDAMEGLSTEAIHRVEVRMMSNLHRPSGWTSPRTWGAAVTAAGFLFVFSLYFWPTPRVSPPAPAGEPAVIVSRSGPVEVRHISPGPVDPTRLPAGSTVTLLARGSVRFSVAGRAQVWARGPGVIEIDAANGLQLRQGSAALSVNTGAGAFSLTVGTARLMVLGTRFITAARDERFVALWVEEGSVRLERPGQPARTLEAGEAVGAASALGPPVYHQAGPDQEFWPSDSDRGGYLQLTSMPDGAAVQQGGRALGQTPLFISLAVGHHEMLVLAAYHEPGEFSVDIRPGEISHRQVVLQVPDTASAPRKKKQAARGGGTLAEFEAHFARGDCAWLERHSKGPPEKLRPANGARRSLMLAECHLRAGDRKAALSAYESLFMAYPRTSAAETATFESARILNGLGRKAAALARFGQYLRTYPSGTLAASATFRRCEITIALGRLAQVRACLTAYRADFPAGAQLAEATILLAADAKRRGDWPNAAKWYRDYLQSVPDGKWTRKAASELIRSLERGGLPGLEEAKRRYHHRYGGSEGP